MIMSDIWAMVSLSSQIANQPESPLRDLWRQQTTEYFTFYNYSLNLIHFAHFMRRLLYLFNLCE